MSIPVVKTAISPSNGMPAHPAPSMVARNVSQLSVDVDMPASHDVAASTSLIQIYTSSDVIFYTDQPGRALIPFFGMPLVGGGYYSFSVDAGCTLHFRADNPATIYVLEG